MANQKTKSPAKIVVEFDEDDVLISHTPEGVIETPVADVPPSILVMSCKHGWSQKASTDASGALDAAYREANGGIAAPDSATRNAWKVENQAAVDAKRVDMINASIAKRLAGEWTQRAESSGDPLDSYRLKAVTEFFKTDAGAAAKFAYDQVDAAEQADRKAFKLKIAGQVEAIEARATALKELAEREAKAAQSAFADVKVDLDLT